MVTEARGPSATPRRWSAAALVEFASRHALALIVIGGAAVRFATLASQGFWFDEQLTIAVITQRPGEILQRLLAADNNPPLYFVVAWAWKAVFGLGEVGLRSLSALAGTATIPVVYAAGRSLASRRVGLVAAALTATSPFMIWYSQEARPYALFTFFAALAFLFFVRALQEADSRWLWAWALSSILAFSTHYFGFLLVAIEGLWLLWRLRGRRGEVALCLGLVAAGGLVLAPLLLAQRKLAGWIPFVSSTDRVLQIPQHFVVGLNSPWHFLPPLAVAAVAAVAVHAVVRGDPRSLHAAAMPAALGGIAVAIPLVAMGAGTDYLLSRNLIGTWVPFAIALAALLAAPRVRRAGIVAVACLCALGLALAVWNATTPAAGRPDWQPLTAALGPPAAARAIESRSPFIAPLEQYLGPGAHTAVAGERDTVKEIDVIALRAIPNYSIGPCWWTAICGGRNLLGGGGDLPVPLPRGFHRTGAGETSLFKYRRYHSAHAVELAPAPLGRLIVQSPP